ncbi:MAG TPA: alpha-amylase family glycosyl hydrolase [Steroidobacter sp.]|uniref:alpha-amylase family glycosyl hydrolase n=1 Tax=Steroidobacter sp. TaxID=1978227 RepID=UPI002EDA2235
MQMRPIRYLFVALCASIGVAASHAANAPIELDTSGGDAWIFDKFIAGWFDSSACDEVFIQGPAGTVRAAVDDDRFSARTPLLSGANEISARCTRNGREVARSVTQRWLTRIEDRPRAWIRSRVADTTILLDGGGSQMAEASAVPIARFEWRARRGNAAPLVLTSQSLLDTTPATTRAIEIRAPDVDGEYYVTLRVTDALGRDDESTTVFEVVDGVPREVDLERHHPKWIEGSVLYGVAPFAFGTNGYDDIRKRLPEIAALGVTAIWLSPITGAPSEDFGYAVTDHFQSRDEFGTTLQLKALIEAAHTRGLRVLMDFIPNHLAAAHRYYVDAERNGSRSPYFSWFERDAQGEPTHYFDWPHLKNLEYDNPEVQRYMLEAFSYWVRELGIDGFRVDVSWGVRERAPEFWPRWREELKRIDPDLLLIAEASARDGYYFNHGFDVAYDWTEKLGEWAWQDAFAGKLPNLDKLRASLLASTRNLPEPGIVLRFLNNNDTGPRFITRHGVDRTRVAATLLLTLPGLPLVYNGDEVGAEFLPYDEEPISWDDRHGLTSFYKRLIALRKEVAALSSPNIELLSTSHDDAVLAYVRTARPNGASDSVARNVLVLLNFSDRTIDLRLPSVPVVSSILGNGTPHDLLTGEQIPTGANHSLRLSPFAARILTAAPLAPLGQTKIDK